MAKPLRLIKLEELSEEFAEKFEGLKEKFKESLPISLERPLMSSFMWGAHQLFRVRGFKCEIRRIGKLKFALWRKTLKPKSLRTPRPKRFVLLPGFGDTPLSWLSVLTLIEPFLRKQFDEIVLVDFPGYNGILANEQAFDDLDLMMDSLFDVLDSLKPHTILGHSLGGFLGTHYAAACASRRLSGRKQLHKELENLIVVDPSGVFESDLDREEWRSKLKTLSDGDIEGWRPFIFDKEPFWFRYFGSQFLTFAAKEEARSMVASSREDHEVQKVLPQIKSKVTLIWGEKDTLIPSSFAASWMKYLTQTKAPPHAAIVKGVGHSPQVEAPAVVAAILAQVLAGRLPHSLGRRWYELIQTG